MLRLKIFPLHRNAIQSNYGASNENDQWILVRYELIFGLVKRSEISNRTSIERSNRIANVRQPSQSIMGHFDKNITFFIQNAKRYLVCAVVELS